MDINNKVNATQFASPELFEKELENREKMLSTALINSNLIELSNDTDTSYIIAKDDNDQYNIFCMVLGRPYSSRGPVPLADVIADFANTNYLVSNIEKTSVEPCILDTSLHRREAIKEELLKTRLSWDDFEPKDKMRIQKTIGRARNTIENEGVNWMSLKNALVGIDVDWDQLRLKTEAFTSDKDAKEYNFFNIEDNEIFAKVCKAAARSWSNTEKEEYRDRMNAIKAGIIVPEGQIIPDNVYLTRYHSDDTVRIETGKDIIFNEKYRGEKLVKSQRIGVVETHDDCDYIAPAMYINDKLLKVHKETFDELIDFNHLRKPTEREVEILDVIKENYPAIYEACVAQKSMQEAIKSFNRSADEER